jgi:PAS domain S-box-containing protein
MRVPHDAEQMHPKHWPAGLSSPLALTGVTLLLCLTTTLEAFHTLRLREDLQSQAELARCVETCRGLLQTRIERIEDSFHLLRKFFRDTRRLTPDLFRALAKHECECRPGLSSLVWAPCVTEAERDVFELRCTFELGTNFCISEPDGSNRLQHAASRPVYFPAMLQIGAATSQLFPGLDMAATDAGRELLLNAEKHGCVAVGAPYEIATNRNFGPAVTLAVPVFWDDPDGATPPSPNKPLRGYFVGTLRLHPFIKSRFDKFKAAGLDFVVLDNTLPQGSNFLCSYHGTDKDPVITPLSPEAVRCGMHQEVQLQFGHQNWTVLFRFSHPPGSIRLGASTSVLFGGLLVSILSASLVYSNARRAEVVETVVVERTAALRQTQSRLETELGRSRQTQIRLRDSERDLLRAEEIAGLGLWKWNWRTNHFFCTSMFWQLHGRAPGEFEPSLEDFIQLASPEDQPRLRQLTEAARQQLPLRAFEHRIPLSGQRERFLRTVPDYMLDEQGHPVGVIGTVIDITASKEAEAELRRQREEYWMIFNLVPALITYRSIDGRILRANQAAANTLGDGTRQIEGRTLHELGFPEAQLHTAADREIFTNGYAKFDVIEPLTLTTGQRIWLKSDKVPYRDHIGRISGLVVLSQDITEQHQTQEELRLSNTELTTLNAFASALNNSLAPDQVFSSLQIQLRGHLGVQAGAIAAFRPSSNGRLNIECSWGIAPEDLPQLHADLLFSPLPTLPAELPAWPKANTPEAPGRHLRIPLLAQGEVIGVIELLKCHVAADFEPRPAFFRALGLAAGAAIQNALFFEQVNQSRHHLRELSLQLIQVQETERRHLGRELHDQIGQLITALKLHLAHQKTEAPPSPVVQILDELVTRVRKLSLDLRPAMLDDLGLIPAIDWLVDRFTTPSGPRVEFEHTGIQHRFPDVLETTAFRIAQEGLTNAIRHSKASSIRVLLWADDTELAVHVEDDGVGFDPAVTSPEKRSTGLSGIQERLRLLGGELTIDSAPGNGTRLIAELPLKLGKSHSLL